MAKPRTGTTRRTTRLDRLPSLTGMRWMAAFLVFGFHIGTLNIVQTSSWHHRMDRVFGLGAEGVAFFFVLSGFVLRWSVRDGDTVRAFWQRRVAKIFPNHAVTWALVIAVMLYWGDQVRPRIAVANLFLLQGWANVPGYGYSINTVSWSLCCELFFYLCFPFVLPLVKRAHTVLLYAIAAALPLAIYEIGIQAWKYLPGTDPTWFTYLFPPVRSLEFWFGVVLGELVVRRVWYGPGLWLATAIGVALYAGNHWIAAPWWRADLTFAFGLLIAGGAKADLRGAWSPWRWRWMVWLGEVSFAFYLVHVVFMTNVLRALHRNGVGWSGSRALPVIVVFLSASIFLAWLLYQFVEKPMMRLLRPRGSKPAVSQLSAEEVAAAVPAHHHHPKPARPAAEPTPVDAPRGDVPARQHQPGPSRTGAAVAEDS